MKLLTKGLLTAGLLMAPSLILMHTQNVTVSAQSIKHEHQINTPSSELDVSQGWEIVNYTSDTLPDVNDVFKQGVETPGKQKCALVQAGNVGDASLTARRIIPMKKGHQYNIDLIYAQFYDQKGSGFIDFNGKKIDATNDSSDQKYTETVTPTEDMDYIITVSFTTEYPGNAYFKLGYDESGNGIDDTTIDFGAPEVNPTPEAGTDEIYGTAYKGNTVEVSDEKGETLGTSKVLDDGSFKIKTNRALHYKEELQIIQKNNTTTSPAATIVVTDTKAPDAPVLDKITDEDLKVSGKAEPYSTVYVTFKGQSGREDATYEGATKEDGTFSINLDQTFHGKTALTAQAVDEANNKSQMTEGEVEFAKALELSLVHHVSSSDESISGNTSRPNCQITVHFGSRDFKGESDNNGKFKIAIDKHAAGTDFSIKAVDPFDVENPASLADIVLPSVPSLTTQISGVKTLEGYTDPGAEVSLKLQRGDTSVSFTATSDAEGKFSIPLKDIDGNPMTLSIGDKLTYTATLSNVGLTSEEGSLTILAY